MNPAITPTRKGTMENELTPCHARRTIFFSVYFVEPLKRVPHS